MTGKVPTRLVILSFAVSLLILVFDVSVPLGVAGGVPYVALVILGIWFPERRYVFILAFIGTALAIVGYLVSPEGGVQWVVWANRGLAVFAIWTTAFLISYLKRKESALRASENMLAEAQHIAAISCPAPINSTQLHQIVMNLTRNAFDAIGEESGEVTVGLEEVELAQDLAAVDAKIKPGRYARIKVREKGCGMAEEVISSIFWPFFTTKEVGQGTGLGLSMVQGIVLDHRGGILVSSEPGTGTVFDVYLPLSGDDD